jgi:hypothetical protein
MVDETGRCHDRIPDEVPRSWSKQTVEEAIDKIKKSLEQRQKDMADKGGGDAGHQRRYQEESKWLRKLEERKGQLEREDAERQRRNKNTAKAVGTIGVGVGIGTILYWTISELSRLFPPRNLVPIP